MAFKQCFKKNRPNFALRKFRKKKAKKAGLPDAFFSNQKSQFG
jgi:hypothetical protein